MIRAAVLPRVAPRTADDLRILWHRLLFEEAGGGELHLERLVGDALVALVSVDQDAIREEEDLPITGVYPPDGDVGSDPGGLQEPHLGGLPLGRKVGVACLQGSLLR